ATTKSTSTAAPHETTMQHSPDSLDGTKKLLAGGIGIHPFRFKSSNVSPAVQLPLQSITPAPKCLWDTLPSELHTYIFNLAGDFTKYLNNIQLPYTPSNIQLWRWALRDDLVDLVESLPALELEDPYPAMERKPYNVSWNDYIKHKFTSKMGVPKAYKRVCPLTVFNGLLEVRSKEMYDKLAELFPVCTDIPPMFTTNTYWDPFKSDYSLYRRRRHIRINHLFNRKTYEPTDVNVLDHCLFHVDIYRGWKKLEDLFPIHWQTHSFRTQLRTWMVQWGHLDVVQRPSEGEEYSWAPKRLSSPEERWLQRRSDVGMLDWESQVMNCGGHDFLWGYVERNPVKTHAKLGNARVLQSLVWDLEIPVSKDVYKEAAARGEVEVLAALLCEPQSVVWRMVPKSERILRRKARRQKERRGYFQRGVGPNWEEEEFETVDGDWKLLESDRASLKPAKRPMLSLFKAAAGYGHLNVIKLLYTLYYPPDPSHSLLTPIDSSSFDLDEFRFDDPRFLCDAIREGHLHILEYLWTVCPALSTSTRKNILEEAVNADHIHIVRFLLEKGYWGCTQPSNAIDKAAGRGNLEMLRLLHVNGVPGCTSEAFDLAAKRGYIHILEYLYENRMGECTPHVYVSACLSGCIDAIRFIRARFPEIQPTSEALESTLTNGKEEVIEFVFREAGVRRCPPGFLTTATRMGSSILIERALKLGLYDACLEDLDSPSSFRRKEEVSEEFKWAGVLEDGESFESFRAFQILEADEAISIAAYFGNATIIRLLSPYVPQGHLRTNTFDDAAMNGQLSALRALYELREERGTTAGMDRAAGRGFLEVVKFLHTESQKHMSKIKKANLDNPQDSPSFCTTLALDSALLENKPKVVHFLHSNRKEGCSPDIL
ncbi:hypothetical protein HDV05_008198, partial [Chytridiales sp. JEL 0842]